jgi:hypothetical protein
VNGRLDFGALLERGSSSNSIPARGQPHSLIRQQGSAENWPTRTDRGIHDSNSGELFYKWMGFSVLFLFFEFAFMLLEGLRGRGINIFDLSELASMEV